MSNALPLSLAAYFIPPDDCVGEFVLLTGYSADYHFLNDALEKFTSNVKSQRAFEGSVSIALMLDPTHQQISPVDCPGLLHLASNPEVTNKFKLLHAKVGLLLFKNKLNNQHTVRLIVSTGNWTRQTLTDSLDLVWSIDYDCADTTVLQSQSDIAKAFDFINYTLGFFTSDLLTSKSLNGKETLTALRYLKFTTVLTNIKPAIGITPRFFDNRSSSLIKQIPLLVKTHANDKKRNSLVLGSGFYEGGGTADKIPTVITSIENMLREAGLLTNNPEKDIYVNLTNCQAIANSASALQDNQWSIRPAFDALYEGKNHQRALHAKFIFSAQYRNDSDECKKPWLYLGSGNLTAPGLLQPASLHGGNLEAGIVFAPQGLNWFGEENPELRISNKLPIDWDEQQLITDETLLNSGAEMPEHDSLFLAAPVCYFSLVKINDELLGLIPSSDMAQDYQVLIADGQACQFENDMFLWPESAPRQVVVSWRNDGQTMTTYVPVLDEFGRLAATVLPMLEIDDAWAQFGSFPILPADDGYDGQIQDEVSIPSGAGPQVNATHGYHLNNMMGLIEHIAQKQTTIAPLDWAQWCNRLEQTFCQMNQSAVFQYFKEVGINPLSPLWAKPFRPIYAEDQHSAEGRLYEDSLNKIETTLKLTGLLTLGADHE